MDYILKYHNVKIGPFSDHELKSAIQKYLRRNETTKGVFSLRLLLSVVQWMEKDPRRVKTILSNAMNRMIVMMSEEISLCEPSLPRLVEHLYRAYLTTNDVGQILRLYDTLLGCRKCRILSDLRAVFLLPFFDDKDLSPADIHHHNHILQDLLPHLIIDEERRISLQEWQALMMTTHPTVETMFYTLGFLLRPSKDRKSIMTAIWNTLIGLSLPDDTQQNIRSLYFLYRKMTHREKTLYLYQAILLAILRPAASPLKPVPDNLDPKFDTLPKQMMHFKLDDYVLDMHTGNQKCTPYQFVMSGAWIAQEDRTYLNPRYRMIYIRKKQIVFHPQPCFYNLMTSPDPKSATIDFQSLFQNVVVPVPDVLDQFTVTSLTRDQWKSILQLPHGQKKCGQHKKVVYIDNDYVYKGPYQRKEKSFLNALFFQMALSKIEITTTILPINVLHENETDTFFLRSRNIGIPAHPSDIEVVTTKIETNVKVIRRGTTLFRVSEVVDELDTLQKTKCLQHLYGRFILNIGDSGLYNILLGKDNEIYGIDLEEQRNDGKFTSVMSLLAQRISKANELVFKDALPWVDVMSMDRLTTILQKQDWPKEYKDACAYRARFIECMLRHTSI